jgi:hypothetical protein
MLTVERLDDGEVSPYQVDELRVGDELELRGPVGGYFVWDDDLGGPLFLVAGASTPSCWPKSPRPPLSSRSRRSAARQRSSTLPRPRWLPTATIRSE